MKNAQKIFEKWYKKFAIKKSFFKKRIETFAKDENLGAHKKGHKLIEDAERLVIEIKDIIDKKGDGKNLNAKLSEFKKIFTKLDKLTKAEWKQWLEALGFAIVVVFVLKAYIFNLYRVPSGSAEPNLLVGDRVIGNKMAYRFGSKPKRGDLVMFYNPVFEYDQYNKLNELWQRHVGYGMPILGLSHGPENFVKRVIGLPGDTIQGKIEDGKTVVYLNGEVLEEGYVNPYPLIAIEKRTGFIDLNRIGPFRVPEVIKKQSKYPLFYTYVPDVEFSKQPYYNMSSEAVGLEPGTLRPWLLIQGTPTKNEYGKIVDVFGPIQIPEGKYWVMGDNRKNSKDSRFWGLLDESLIHGRASMIIYSIDSEEPFWLFELIKNPVKFWTKSLRWSRSFKKLWLKAPNDKKA